MGIAVFIDIFSFFLSQLITQCVVVVVNLPSRACHEAKKVTRNIGPMFFVVDLIYIKTEKNKILKNFKILVVQKLHFF